MRRGSHAIPRLRELEGSPDNLVPLLVSALCALALALAAFLGGCSSKCLRNSECDVGFMCTPDGDCLMVTADASVDGGGEADADLADADLGDAALESDAASFENSQPEASTSTKVRPIVRSFYVSQIAVSLTRK